MATKTLAELLLGLGAFTKELVIPRAQFAGTADTDGTAALLKDTELNVFADDYFNSDYWVYITAGGTSGGGAGSIRNIENFTQTGGIVDPDIDFSGIPKIGATYQIWKCHVQDIIDALNDALVSIYSAPPRPKLYRKIVFETLGQDDLAQNAAAAQAVVEVSDDTLFFVGQVVTVTDDNDSETATIESIDAATNKLTMEDNLTNAYTTAANAKVVAQSGKYFNLGATIGNARVTGLFLKTDDESTRTRQTAFEIIQSLAGDRQIYFPDHTVSVDDQTLIIEAMGKLETVTASSPTGTVTIDAERVGLLYAEAAYHFYLRQAREVSSGDIERLMALARDYRRMVYDDLKSLWMPRIIEYADMTTDSD